MIAIKEDVILNAESDNDLSPVVNENDRDAARRALAQNWPDLEQTSPKYAALLEGIAEFHALCGTDNFELRYNLRPPKDRIEKWTQQFMHEEITETELRARLKADAERPFDLEMLTAFYNGYQDKLAHYSGVLQAAVVKPSEEGTSVVRRKEREINDHIVALRNKMPLFRQNLETIFDFLEDLRITSGRGLLKLGDFEGTSAHWLAELAFTRMTEAWRSCTEVSKRSQTDSRYLYPATAIELFSQQSVQSFPSPQSIFERLREEFVLARAAISGRDSVLPANPDVTPNATIDAANIDHEVDNESRELILIGDVFTLVGGAGHIFRPTSNSDWGIDGEIEFKDNKGRASGQRVYLQLKSGDSHLIRRKNDGEEVFTVKKERHWEYWSQQAYPVMLVVRQSSGLIRWMDISAYIKKTASRDRQIVFCGESFTVSNIRRLAEKLLGDIGHRTAQ